MWPETGLKCTPVYIPHLALSRGRATAVPDLPAEKETRKFSISASNNGWVSDFAARRCHTHHLSRSVTSPARDWTNRFAGEPAEFAENRKASCPPNGQWSPIMFTHRHFQFTLRTLFIAIILLSLPLGLFGNRMHHAMRQREAVSVFCAAGVVAYDYELDEDGQRVAHEDPGSRCVFAGY